MDWHAAEVRVEDVGADQLPALSGDLELGSVRFVVGPKGVGIVRGEQTAWLAGLPLRPLRGALEDPDGDGCPDLLLADELGEVVRVVGTCSEAHEPEEPRLVIRKGVTIDVAVGESLQTRLLAHDNRAWQWTSRGGPPGFWVHRDGTVDYDFTVDDVGRYELQLRQHPGIGRTSVELRVHPQDGDDVALADQPLQKPRRVIDLPDVACSFGLGAASAVSYTSGGTWMHLGYPALQAVASPNLSSACSLGDRPLAATVGGQLFPWLDLEPRESWGAGQAGLEYRFGRQQVGGFFELAAGETRLPLPFGLAPGLGLHYHVEVAHRTGPDLQLVWLAPNGVRTALGWTWTPGRSR